MRLCPPDCPYLSPTEEEQKTQDVKAEHRCGKYFEPLIHGECHPELIRCAKCLFEQMKSQKVESMSDPKITIQLENQMYSLLRLLGWRELVFRFLDGVRPVPRTINIVIDAIVNYDGKLPGQQNLRYHDHEFVVEAVAIIEYGQKTSSGFECSVTAWLTLWNSRYGMGGYA